MDRVTKTSGLPPKLKVVVIDDDPIFGNVLSYAGAMKDLSVRCYDDLEATDPQVLHDADLVVLDYHLGGERTGVEVGRRLAASHIDVPMLLVSSSTDALLDDGWPRNMRDFAAKSLGPFGVLESIREVLAREDTAEEPVALLH